MARTSRRATAPAPEPEVAETVTEETVRGGKRGPGPLHYGMTKWLKAENPDAAFVKLSDDQVAEIVYLAQTERRAFRDSDVYEAVLAEQDEAREAAETAKAARKAEREAAAEADEPEATEEAPKARRGRAAKAAAPAATEPVTEEAPVRARRSRAAKATTAPAEEPTTEAPAKATRRRSGSPF